MLMLIVLIVIGSSIFIVLTVSSSFNNSTPIATPVSSSRTNVNTVSSSSASTSVNTTSNSPPAPGMRISVPLYSNPNGEWNQVVSSSPTTDILIINPNFGPGYSPDPNYASAIQTAQQKGINILGYVYYTALYNYTKAQTGPDIVILNPGGPAGNCYAPISDILVTFEGDYSDFINHYVADNWTVSYPSSRFWQIVYNATTLSQVQNAVQLALQRGSGWIFVTNGLSIGVNALGRLPPYFCQEVEVVNSNSTCSSTTTNSSLG